MPRRKPGLSPHPLSAMRVEQAYSDMSLLLNKRLTALYALPLALSTDAQNPRPHPPASSSYPISSPVPARPSSRCHHPTPLDREILRSLKRADLQRMRVPTTVPSSRSYAHPSPQDYSIKANLKTEVLIELLVDTTQAARPTPAPPPPFTRIASRATANSRFRGSSTPSGIIHDTDEEDNAVTDDPFTSGLSAPPSEASTAPAPPPRRLARETQYKLGVGRLTAAGGHGARAVTRTASLSQKGKR